MCSSHGVFEGSTSLSFSYAVVCRADRVLTLLNAGAGDRVDLVFYITERGGLILQYGNEDVHAFFNDGAPYEVHRIIFRTIKGSIVTARSNSTLDQKVVRDFASSSLFYESKFLQAFEGAVKITRLGKDQKYYEEKCVICREEYKAGDMIGTLECCKHRYHGECIKKLLTRRCFCPICRNRVLDNTLVVMY
ncbi:putative chromatin regulator PHD family [Helianthus debilis subsp. tardiflorus]